MGNHGNAVGRGVDVGFENVRTGVKGFGEGRKGVFRNAIGETTVGNHQEVGAVEEMHAQS